MPKWKLQAVEPDTCNTPGCRYIELWDVEADPLLRTQTVVAFDRVCAGHASTVSPDKMLWEDGNWKNKVAYIAYQRAWFRRLNHVAWLIDNPSEPMPPQIAEFTSDPVSPGSVASPSRAEVDGMNEAYAWNKRDNIRKNTSLDLVETEVGTRDEATWDFTGTGDTRTLTVTEPTLNDAEAARVQSALDIQFGTDEVTVSR